MIERTGASRLLCLGDIDARGLNIRANADARRRSRRLAGIEPARELYGWILDHGRPAPNGPRTQPEPSVAGWLGPALAPRILPIVGRGERIAQEHLGAVALAGPLSGWRPE